MPLTSVVMSFDTGGDGLRGRKQSQVGLDEIDAWILAERLQPFLRNFRGESIERVSVSVARLEAERVRDLGGRVTVFEDDDEPAWDCIGLKLLGHHRKT